MHETNSRQISNPPSSNLALDIYQQRIAEVRQRRDPCNQYLRFEHIANEIEQTTAPPGNQLVKLSNAMDSLNNPDQPCPMIFDNNNDNLLPSNESTLIDLATEVFYHSDNLQFE